jgi:hypothetical protein
MPGAWYLYSLAKISIAEPAFALRQRSRCDVEHHYVRAKPFQSDQSVLRGMDSPY